LVWRVQVDGDALVERLLVHVAAQLRWEPLPASAVFSPVWPPGLLLAQG
jgi:hypothetical protein